MLAYATHSAVSHIASAYNALALPEFLATPLESAKIW